MFSEQQTTATGGVFVGSPTGALAEFHSRHKAIQDRLRNAAVSQDLVEWKRRATVAEQKLSLRTVELATANKQIETIRETVRRQAHKIYILEQGAKREHVIPTSISKIVQAVAIQFSIPVYEILGKPRNPSVVDARFTAVYLVKTFLPDFSYPQIGRAFKKHYSSMIHAVQTIEKRVIAGGYFAEQVEAAKTMAARSLVA